VLRAAVLLMAGQRFVDETGRLQNRNNPVRLALAKERACPNLETHSTC
jgi:hypothetical protein